MDLLNSFMNKNLDDFVKSYAIIPGDVENKDIGSVEHKEYSQTETPTQEISNKESTSNELLDNSFISGISMIESVSSETNQSFYDSNSNSNNKIYGKYGKKTFDLSMDILPIVNIKEDESKIIDDNEKWKELPNIVNTSINFDNKTAKLNKENKTKSAANDSFLCNIAKEIERLDEELSSMGLLTNTVHSSDIEHDEEEKMEILLDDNNDKIQLNHQNIEQHNQLQQSHDNNKIEEETQSEEDIAIIKDKLSLLRRSLVFKKDPMLTTMNEEQEKESSPPKTPTNELGEFATKKHKDAFFDPLVSPPTNIKHNNKENCINYNQAIHHENATKIQKQWKKFQFKTILVNTFNRHLKQCNHNNVMYILYIYIYVL